MVILSCHIVNNLLTQIVAENLRNQRDLVEVVAQLKQVVCVKGKFRV